MSKIVKLKICQIKALLILLTTDTCYCIHSVSSAGVVWFNDVTSQGISDCITSIASCPSQSVANCNEQATVECSKDSLLIVCV